MADVAEQIETLTDRLQTATYLEDLRGACHALRSTARKYRVEVGAQAMEPLLETLRNDRGDNEITDHCLHALSYIISGTLADVTPGEWQHPDLTGCLPSGIGGDNTHNNSTPSTSHGHDPGRELSEIFLKRAENVATVIDATRYDDFKTRLAVVRILCGLARHKLEMVQDAILSDPLNLSKLSQLVADKQDLIKYDSLFLFVHLTQNNQNIQKVLAYENFFDKIMDIIALEERYLNGQLPVINDCLNILLNMTQLNETNRTLFREGGHIQKLLPFLESIQTVNWTLDETTCIVLVLQILGSMVAPSNSPDTVRRCQEIMLKCGILDRLCGLLTANSMPIGVLSETMNTVSDIIKGQLEPNANTVMQTSSMMPIILLTMVKEMCQDQEKRFTELYDQQEKRISELYNYMHVLHDFVSSKSKQ